MWRYDSLSPEEKLMREIQKQKFYATLPHKIDSAVDDYLSTNPKPDPLFEWQEEEVGEFGQDGWSIGFSHKSVSKDDA